MPSPSVSASRRSAQSSGALSRSRCRRIRAGCEIRALRAADERHVDGPVDLDVARAGELDAVTRIAVAQEHAVELVDEDVERLLVVEDEPHVSQPGAAQEHVLEEGG